MVVFGHGRKQVLVRGEVRKLCFLFECGHTTEDKRVHLDGPGDCCGFLIK